MTCERGYKPPRREVLTEHFKNERLDRYVFIVMNIGLGDPIKTIKVIDEEGLTSYHTITTTGIIIIRNPQNKLITLYVAKRAQAEKFFEGKMPIALEGKINYNIGKNYHNLSNGKT